MSDKIQSLPYQPNPAKCCERCVFDSGRHAEWCAQYVRDELMANARANARLISMIEHFDACHVLQFHNADRRTPRVNPR